MSVQAHPLIIVSRYVPTLRDHILVHVILDTPYTVMVEHAMVSANCIDVSFLNCLINSLSGIDINECASSTSNDCEHRCTNTLGSYSCSCNSGYRLNSDGRTCGGNCGS